MIDYFKSLRSILDLNKNSLINIIFNSKHLKDDVNVTFRYDKKSKTLKFIIDKEDINKYKYIKENGILPETLTKNSNKPLPIVITKEFDNMEFMNKSNKTSVFVTRDDKDMYTLSSTILNRNSRLLIPDSKIIFRR